MSAYNTVRGVAPCPSCGATEPVEVQFKYGEVRQHSYDLGDSLRWGPSNVGAPGQGRVRVEGIAGPCPSCGKDFIEYDVLVEDDVLRGIEPVRGARVATPGDGYIVEA